VPICRAEDCHGCGDYQQSDCDVLASHH
jgi:hypothetical protein